MRLYLLLLFLLLLASGAPVAAQAGSSADLPTLRHLYAEASVSEVAANQLRLRLRGYAGADAAVLAYQAVGEALQARYGWSPLAKLRAVRAAQELFGRAVALEPDNVEVRFLRFTVESHIPRYLGFSPHLADDRAHIMRGARHFPSLGLDGQSQRMIRDFMLLFGDCSPEEARLLRAVQPGS